jgi:DNA-binding response OmpR family regulator
MRILVIDDDKSIRDMLSQHLRTECYAVDTAEDGAEGSYMARTNNYDLVVMDNLLPEKSGIFVCEDIRRTGQNVPILVLSVLGEARQKISLINAGADDYMVKPFSFEELTARIRALLRRPIRYESDTLTIGELSLNLTQHLVWLCDEKIYLTRKEFMLLEYLMRNKDAVLSRGMIMEHVWDMSSDPFSNTIESHILSLRKKLNDTVDRRYIKTVPGRGYKIESN